MLLSENEVNKRLIRLRNLENLHLKAREGIIWLEKENEKLRKRIKELGDRNKDQNPKIESLSFQFEQIKNKLYGQKPEVLRKSQSKSPKLKIIQLKSASIVAKNSKGNQFEFSLKKTSLCQFKKSS